MPGSDYRDEDQYTEKTPFNSHADYHEVEHDFRRKLDQMLPEHLAERVQQVIKSRFKNKNKDEAEAI